MKSFERMFYVAIAIWLLVKFPWLIGAGIFIWIFLAAIIDNSEEGKNDDIRD